MKPYVLVRELGVRILEVVEHETGHDRAAGDEDNRRDPPLLREGGRPRLQEVEDEEVRPQVVEDGREVFERVI